MRSDMNSIVRVYKDNNYVTIGLHPNTKNFYNRKKAYKFLGFQETVFSEDIEKPEYKANNISDNEFANQVIKKFEEHQGKKFIFGVTMQNHMPYINKKYSQYNVSVESDVISNDEKMELRNYVQGVYDGDQMYGKLVEYLKKREEPTILVMFGDHLPALTNTDIYESSQFKQIDYYETPYIIWANYDFDYNNMPSVMSPSNLSINVLKMCGVEMPWYLKKFEQLYNVYPVINNQVVIENSGRILMPEVVQNYDIVNDCRILQYDLLIKKKYIAVE